MSLIVSDAQLPRLRDMQGRSLSLSDLKRMHIESVRDFAVGVLEEYRAQSFYAWGRRRRAKLPETTGQYAESVAAWCSYLLLKHDGIESTAPECPSPHQLSRPKDWPSIVYTWHDELVRFLGGEPGPVESADFGGAVAALAESKRVRSV